MQKSASPYSTGGGGTVFEHRYGAILMTHLLAGAPWPELHAEAYPQEIHFQALSESPVDDYLLIGQLEDSTHVKAAIACRRDPKIQASNIDSRQLLKSFMQTLDVPVDSGRFNSTHLVLVSTIASLHARELRDLVEIATAAPASNIAFRAAIALKGRTTSQIRGRLKQLDLMMTTIIKEGLQLNHLLNEAPELSWILLRSLRVRLLDLEGAVEVDRANAVQLLTPLTPDRSIQQGSAVFSRLAEKSGKYAQTGRIISSSILIHDLEGLLNTDLTEIAGRIVSRPPAVVAYRASIKAEIASIRAAPRISLGLSDSEVKRSFSVPSKLPAVLEELSDGRILALRGPLGSGKTDLAAAWLERRNEISEGVFDSALPIWLRAEELQASLSDTIRDRVGAENIPTIYGVLVVIDGLDERQAGLSLVDIQAFVHRYPKSQIVLTTREGQQIPASFDLFDVPEWEIEDAKELISKIVEEPIWKVGWKWSPALAESVKRPLFALMVAKHWKSHVSGSPASLIGASVAEALSGRAHSSDLEKLAMHLTLSGHPLDMRSLTEFDWAAVLSTRLLIVQNNRVRFALPIIEQWFAAQAILSNRLPIINAIKNLEDFARWRYVLSVAISIGTHETISPILLHLARWNPGAASWVLREGLSADLDSNTFSLADQPYEFAEAIWDAAAAWAEGLQSLSIFTRPSSVLSDPIAGSLDGLRLYNESSAEATKFTWTDPTADDSHNLIIGSPPQGSFLSATTQTNFSRPIGEGWAWKYTFDTSADNQLALALSNHEILVAACKGGIVERENRAWHIAQTLGVSERYPAFITEELARSLLARAKRWPESRQRPGRLVVSVEEVESRLNTRGAAAVNDTWPKPDIRLANGLPDYSAGQLAKRVVEVYEAAGIAYCEIASGLLEPFGAILTHKATFPAIMEMGIKYDLSARMGDFIQSAVEYWFRPLSSTAPEETKPLTVNLGERRERGDDWQGDPDGIQFLTERRLRDPLGTAFESSSWVSSIIPSDFYGRRPATATAVRWILSDLKELGWVKNSHQSIR